MRRGYARLLCAIVFSGGIACAHAVSDTDTDADAELSTCPGGAQWLAAEEARQAANPLPPEAPPRKPALRDELLRMGREDQAARAFLMSGKEPTPAEQDRLQATDARDLARLQQIVRDSGFPNAADVGRDAVAAAWLLVQHANADPGFQQQILSQIQGLGEGDGISGQDVALLTDRVLLAQGKPQRYGTQYEGGMGSPLRLRPLEDPAGVDARRAALHLMPSATYACALGKMYGSNVVR